MQVFWMFLLLRVCKDKLSLMTFLASNPRALKSAEENKVRMNANKDKEVRYVFSCMH